METQNGNCCRPVFRLVEREGPELRETQGQSGIGFYDPFYYKISVSTHGLHRSQIWSIRDEGTYGEGPVKKED